MKISLLPKNAFGTAAFICLLICIAMFLLGTGGLVIAGIGIVGFILAITAVIKKDRSIASLVSLLGGLGITAVCAAILIGSMGLFKDFPVKSTLTQAETGEALGRTANLGTISESGGWIYYVYDEGLYKRKTDWTEKTKLARTKVNSIYVSDEWIYFSGQENAGLYKVKTDGTGEVKISEDRINKFMANGDWVFYTTGEKFASQPQAGAKVPLYRIKTDGNGKTKLADAALESSGPKTYDSWIYYAADGNLFKINIDGTGQTLLSENAGVDYVQGEWIYYVSTKDEGGGLAKVTLNKLKTDGTEKAVSAEISGVYAFAFDGDYLYYTTFKETFRMNLDGTGKERLNSVEAWGLMGVSGNWMYINDYEGPMWRVKLDGSVGTRLN